MPLLGTCSGCGARCKTAEGASPGVNTRGVAIAGVVITGRQLAYAVEGIDRETGRHTTRLICRECVIAAMGRAAV